MEIQEKDRDPRPAKTEEKPKDNPPRLSRIDHDDPVEEASDESFPASDPPGSY